MKLFHAQTSAAAGKESGGFQRAHGWAGLGGGGVMLAKGPAKKVTIYVNEETRYQTSFSGSCQTSAGAVPRFAANRS
jgi:hypothetical protein